ncbi:CRISPR-associated protein Cmr4 [Caminicella sporogenes DSM 14501]|uniref:CRISPR-associated protein Cmr4 n=1 Tax=Caminicella sporogenes DSM 14501 TaxID=1121266 RepID=A0A1M6LSV8_9FIRM|nr:type III-B CRISPR module RAMP protein Cmr4 [Caminicella sporogenes]RKD27938.1 type III-B CRISPR module RAMP protein Cmr4 [Caminicella sporogenes]SHJ74245.1 CRISPR-associated protein Cmr4 [Caminicella sporogenes DSM 14501]
MYSSATPILFKAVTPVHAGTGRELGIIDMPIQKESHTGIPKIEGASIKGCMREAYRLKNKDKSEENILFGYEDGNDGAGLIGFSDAKLLFYPIKSVQNLFTYITCTYLINRFLEDKNFMNKCDIKSILEDIKEGQAIIYTKNKDIKKGKKIVLDVYDFEIDCVCKLEENCDENDEKCCVEDIRELYKKLELKRDIAVLNDTDFMEIISLNREVITRNRIDHETGIVKNGGLFIEEYLPAESVLYSLLLVNGILEEQKKNKELVKRYKQSIPKLLQIGGNKTIGKGIVKALIYEGDKDGNNEKR